MDILVLEKLESSKVLEELESVLVEVESSTMDKVSLLNHDNNMEELEINLVNMLGFFENGVTSVVKVDLKKKFKEKDKEI